MIKHPLLNSDSKHYDKEGKKPAIQEMESMLTVSEMIGVCKFSIYKYSYRDKGQQESDLKKIKTYQNYLKVLKTCSHNARPLKTVEEYFIDAKMEYSYG